MIGIASWTKSDAQNVSFAIPAQEFNRLKVSQRPVSWEQAAAREHSAPPKRRVTSRLTTDTVLKPEAVAGNFAGFQKWLEASAGKSVTVVAHESGRTNVFTFTVK